jgi:hypothetical protein
VLGRPIAHSKSQLSQALWTPQRAPSSAQGDEAKLPGRGGVGRPWPRHQITAGQTVSRGHIAEALGRAEKPGVGCCPALPGSGTYETLHSRAPQTNEETAQLRLTAAVPDLVQILTSEGLGGL